MGKLKTRRVIVRGNGGAGPFHAKQSTAVSKVPTPTGITLVAIEKFKLDTAAKRGHPLSRAGRFFRATRKAA